MPKLQSQFCQKIWSKLTSCNQDTGREGCCISSSCLSKEKEEQVERLDSYSYHSILKWLDHDQCKHTVCKGCDFLPVEPSAIVAGYQMLPHLAQAQDARASCKTYKVHLLLQVLPHEYFLNRIGQHKIWFLQAIPIGKCLNCSHNSAKRSDQNWLRAIKTRDGKVAASPHHASVRRKKSR